MEVKVVCFVLCLLICGSSGGLLELDPDVLTLVYEQDYLDVTVGVNESEFKMADGGLVLIQLRLRDDWLTRAELLNTSLNLTADEPFQNFTVKGIFLGFAFVELSYCEREVCLEEDFLPTNQTVEIGVIRRQRIVDILFTVLILCLVVTANLAMGCKVDIKVVKEVLKRPTAPVIGFMCQFCIMPPLSFMLGRVFNLSTAEQIGLLAIGSSPGGGASNMWTLLLDGDVSLSITMTLISTVASLGMFPLWMFTLGKIVMDEAHFTIPFQNILGTLVGILVPVGIGILLQYKLPNVARKIAKATKPMLFVFILFLFTFGLWVNWFMFRLFHLKLIGAACLLPYLGYISSGVVAWLLRQPRRRVIAICIETGIQNVGVAIFALRLSLPQPLNDLSIVGAVCPPSFTTIPLLIILISLAIHKRCCKKEDDAKYAHAQEEDGAITEQNGVMTDLSRNGNSL